MANLEFDFNDLFQIRLVHLNKNGKIVIFLQTHQLNVKLVSEIGSLDQPLRGVFTIAKNRSKLGPFSNVENIFLCFKGR
jgi:hypothetical protein